MDFAKTRFCLTYMLRYWLLIAIVFLFGFALATKPVAWAASVPGGPNQTVPPLDFQLYLPLIKLLD